MTTYPKTAYQVGARYGTTLIERVLLRETANYFFFADRYTVGKEDKVFKDRVNIFFTFEEAKTALVDKKRSQLERAMVEVEEAKVGLAKAEALTGPTHKDDPTEMTSAPLSV